MVLQKAKRMVEFGEDVVILLDSITRLGRAHNAVIPHSGKILSGGVDFNALKKSKEEKDVKAYKLIKSATDKETSEFYTYLRGILDI